MRLLRLVAAWSWLRWRSLLNSLAGRRRAGSGKVSAWVGLLVTGVLGLVAAGASAALSIGAWFAGRALAGGDLGGAALPAIRIAAAILMLLLALFAVLAGGRSATSDWTRLLLLPVARRELHALELLAGLGDPWLLVAVPPLLALALAFTTRGLVALLVAGVGAALLLLVLGALASLLSLLVQLLLRDRRRAEVVVLVGLLVVMTIGWVPGLMLRGERRGERDRGDRHRGAASLTVERIDRWLLPVPTEAYARTLRWVASGEPSRAAGPLAILAGEALVLYSLSALSWKRLVESPAVGSRRRGTLRLPRLASPSSPAGHPAVAVARAQVATTLRTVQGRVALVTPLLMVAAFSLTTDLHRGPFALFAPLLGATAVLALGPLSVLVFQAALLNQFGVDGAGFSLQVLSPLGERALVGGRALGGAMLALVALMPALLVAALIHRSTPWPLWPATLLGAMAAYLLFAPAALWLSMLFPKAADLSKLGSKGKPHGAAAVAGVAVVSFALAAVQAAGAAGFLLGGAAGALLAETLLAAAAAAVAWPLLLLVAETLPARRDALLLALRAG